MNRTTLKIDGMSCGHCVMAVRKALEEVEGVRVEQVAIGTATVEYDPAVADAAAVIAAVDEAGYTAVAAE